MFIQNQYCCKNSNNFSHTQDFSQFIAKLIVLGGEFTAKGHQIGQFSEIFYFPNASVK